MSHSKYLQQVFGTIVVIVLLAGCNMPVAAPSPASTLPPQSPAPTFPPPATPIQTGQPPDQPTQAAEQPELFKFIQTIQVTPDQNFKQGGFARIFYVPATDRFVVTFGTDNSKPSSKPVNCSETGGGGIAYKEYSTEMQETGKSGRAVWDPAACQAGDMGYVMVDNVFYAVWKPNWQLIKVDAVSWKKLAEVTIPLDSRTESPGDPMVAYVNGQIDVSSGYNLTGKPHNGLNDPPGTYGTHHHLFSTDLEFQGEKILTEPGHIGGSYMVFVDGIYYLVTADDYIGDVIVAKYDKDWKYLGGKTLIKQAHFSTGLVYDNGRFYLAYTDTSQRSAPTFFPVFLNIHLAAFDRDWNLLSDVAVTNFTPSDNYQPGRPWVILHGNRLYVSYDLGTLDPVTHEDLLVGGQAIVSVYELAQ